MHSTKDLRKILIETMIRLGLSKIPAYTHIYCKFDNFEIIKFDDINPIFIFSKIKYIWSTTHLPLLSMKSNSISKNVETFVQSFR